MESLIQDLRSGRAVQAGESQIWSGLECFSLDGDVARWLYGLLRKMWSTMTAPAGLKICTIGNVGKHATKIAIHCLHCL